MLWLSGRVDGHRLGKQMAADGVIIPYRVWWRPGARAVILYLHGQGGHSGPFTAMGDELHGHGYNVYAWDHRGFGLSQEPRGDITSYDRFVEDGLEMVRLARYRSPDLPVFLLGLSMGGHLAIRAAYRAGDQVAGVIALSPGFKLRKPPPWWAVLKGALVWVFAPTRYLPPVGTSVVTTRNQTHLERAQQDEHWVTRYTARYLFGMLKSIYRARWEARRLRVPTLFLQAGNDFLTCPAESRRFFDLINHPDKEFRLLEGLCHNLVAEPEMPQIALDVAAWIDLRLNRPHGV